MESFKEFLIKKGIIGGEKVEPLFKGAVSVDDVLKKLSSDSSVPDQSLIKAFAGSFKKKALSDVLLEERAVDFDTLQRVVAESGNMTNNLGHILVERRIISDEMLAKAVGIELGVEYKDLTDYKVDDAIFNSIDVSVMKKYCFIPHKKTNKEIWLIMSDPGNVDSIEELEVLLGLPIIPMVASKLAIQRLLNLMIETSLDSKVIFADLDNFPPLEVVTPDEEDAQQNIAQKSGADSDSCVIKMVDAIILKGVRKRSSDIHFEVYESQLKVKYRIDGVLFEVVSDVEPRMRAPIISRLKVMAQLDIAEKRIPQDGRFKLKIDDRFVDFRVSVLPSIFGETVVLRILDKSALGLDLQKVGLDGNDLLLFKRNVSKHTVWYWLSVLPVRENNDSVFGA